MLFLNKSTLIKTLKNEHVFPPPLWIMRQAGRYLPEYRELREKTKNFLDFCYNPELVVKASMQPIERFNFDAAIIFSDILVIPDALGSKVSFSEKGVSLEPIEIENIEQLKSQKETFHIKLSPVYESIKMLRKILPKEKALIGFSGAPWTLATYMIDGKNTPEKTQTRRFFYQNPKAMMSLLDILSSCITKHIIEQITAGANVIQIFDSWAGMVDGESFNTFCTKPIKNIIKNVKKIFPDVPIIGFPRGSGVNYIDYKKNTGVDAISLDWTIPIKYAKKLQNYGPIQGNLDPIRLLQGGFCLEEGIEKILSHLGKKPFIFNLGHGILPNTPISHVEFLVKKVKEIK